MDLLRHGATTRPGCYCGSTDVALSDEGLLAMRQRVAGRRWQCIVSSPLARCAHFADALAAELGVSLRYDARWRELHFGDWEGLPVHAIDEAALGAFWRDPVQHAPPGSESLHALQARVLAASAEILADAAQARTLVVAHGGPIRVLLAAARGMAVTRAHEIEVPLASLWTLPDRR